MLKEGPDDAGTAVGVCFALGFLLAGVVSYLVSTPRGFDLSPLYVTVDFTRCGIISLSSALRSHSRADWIMFPTWATAVLILGAVFIVIENLFVIILVLLRHELRTYTNGFIVSLALSDFLVGGVLIPVYLAQAGAQVSGFMISIILYTNVATILAVTIERYIAILKPFLYETVMAKHFTKIIALSWIIPIIVSLVPLFWEEQEYHLSHKIYIGFLSIFFTILPLIFIIVTYCLVFREVLKQTRFMKQYNCHDRQAQRSHLEKEARDALIFASISAIFIASWAPTISLSVIDLILNMPEIIPPSLYLISIFLIEVSSLSNAIVYAFHKTDFKVAVKKMLPRSCQKPTNYDTVEYRPNAASQAAV